MARQKDLMSRLADAGEEAFARMAGSQTTTRVVESIGSMRERMDDLQRKVRGIDELEKRVAKLEKEVAALSKPKTTRAKSTSGTTARKTPSSRTSARSQTPKETP